MKSSSSCVEDMNLVKNLPVGCRSDTRQVQDGAPNNNEDYFGSAYTLDPNQQPSNGRMSRESAISLSSDGSEDISIQIYTSSGNNSSSSGRSSASRDLALDSHSSNQDDTKLLNLRCNRVPELEEALSLIDKVRVKFLNTLDDEKNANELYDNLDIDEMRKKLPTVKDQEQSVAFRWISRYLDFNRCLANNGSDEDCLDKDIDGAVDKIREYLKFRRLYQLSRTLPDHFAKEFFLLSGIFPFGYDKQHVPVLYMRARIHRKWSEKLDDSFRRYVAWQVDRMTKSYPGAEVSKTIGNSGKEKDGSFGICFDCLGVSYACVDTDFLRYLVRLLVNYYPTYCRYALCVDLPWLFRSVWKLVRSWLPEDARNSVHLITSKQLTDFVDESQISNSMNFNDLSAKEKPNENKHPVPENFSSIREFEELAEEFGLSSSEIKHFKTHLEKVCQEYKQLGAL